MRSRGLVAVENIRTVEDRERDWLRAPVQLGGDDN
jgi:hypothetical protein